jgi:hypothetical protein
MAMKASGWASSSPRHRVFLFSSLLLISIAMVGCGGGSGSGFHLGSGSNNSLLKGQYAFAYSGESNGSGFVTAAGSFTADGNGNMTAGMMDIVIFGSNSAAHSNANFTGTYVVGSDNRGNAVLKGVPGCGTWQFTLTGSSHGLMSCFGLGTDPVVTASGAMDAQNSAAFTTASLSGKYVLGFGGVGATGGVMAMAGQCTMDGSGHITTGELDINDSLSVLHPTNLVGTYSVGASNGRGTAQITSTFGTQNFAFYVVNANDIKFMETDVQPTVSGEVLSQASAPFNLNGSYAFILGGVDGGLHAQAAGGIVTANGTGTLNPNGAGVMDVNDNAIAVTVGLPLAPTAYSFNNTGRGTAFFGNVNIALYPAANGTINLVEIDGNNVMSGTALAQSGTPLGVSALSGNYALNFTGTNFIVGNEEDVTGLLSSSGNGSVSGILDINNFGNITQGVGILPSTYTPGSVAGISGYGNGSINTSSGNFNMQVYQVNSKTVLLLDVDGNNSPVPRVLTGVLQQ